MRDEHDRDSLIVEVLQERHDLDAAAGVEVAGGLVGEHDARFGHQRPRDRDALLLAARELVGHVPEAVAETDALEGLSRQARSLRSTARPRR